MVGTPNETNKKVNVTIGFVLWIGAVCFSLGVLYTKVLDADRRTTEEVGGLRADWERDRELQERRLEVLEEEIKQLTRHD